MVKINTISSIAPTKTGNSPSTKSTVLQRGGAVWCAGEGQWDKAVS